MIPKTYPCYECGKPFCIYRERGFASAKLTFHENCPHGFTKKKYVFIPEIEYSKSEFVINGRSK